MSFRARFPYAAPCARAVTDPALRRLIRALAAEVAAGTVAHPGPVLPPEFVERRGMWAGKPRPARRNRTMQRFL